MDGGRMNTGGQARLTLLLSVHSTALGGAERCALAEAQRLSRSYDLIIAAPDGPLRADFAACGRLVDGPRLLPIWGETPRRWAIQLVRTALDTVRLARLIRREQIAGVVCNSSAALSPVLAGRLMRRPIVIHMRDSLNSRLGHLLVRVEARLATTIIPISDHLATLCGVRPQARIVQIGDGIRIPTEPGRRRVGFRDPVCLGIVAAIDRGKGQDVGISALRELQVRGVAAQLHLVGREQDPEYAAELRDAIQKQGVEGVVYFHGERSDLEAIYADLDVLLLPSRRDISPLVVLEALARRLPVIASRVGSVPRLLLDGKAGVLVEPDDPSALAAAVVMLRANPGRAQSLGKRGRVHVVENYDLERSLDLGCAEIARVLENGAKPATGDGPSTPVPTHLPSKQRAAGSLSSDR
jgi:glycosyltransferase involved in cell wall biosynthesis